MRMKLAVAAGLLALLGVGFAIGVWVTARGYENHVIAPLRYEMANRAAVRVQNLSLLRIGATEDAIRAMEAMLDTETLALTQETTDPEQMPPDVVRALKQVKAYRGIYPPDGAAAGKIGNALANIPGMTDFKRECQAGLCRLLESRRQEAGPSAGADIPVQP